eukprot:gene10239-13773_t
MVTALKIALHAQVYPDDKIVGSVITTDGMRKALKYRKDVEYVEIFYPAHYDGILDYSWDFVLIEGWFPSMNQFISLIRNNFQNILIFFYSLDPIYPGVEIMKYFDIDGLISNSQILLDQVSLLPNYKIPKMMMLLAADTDMMKPNNSIPRDWGAVYVGAGGNMLMYKPRLYETLVELIQFKLRLHGSSWKDVPILNKIQLGPLPQYEIANAYSSAYVVVGSTIEAQNNYEMINNRVFEALSCGTIFISEYSSGLMKLLNNTDYSDIVIFIEDKKDFLKEKISNIISNETQSNL